MNTSTQARHYETILELAKEAKGIIQDDHNQGRNKITLAGVAIFRKEGSSKDGHVVGLYNSKAFCLNGLYVDDGEVHVSTFSVGGTVLPMDHEGDVKAAVEAFNASQADNQWSMGTLDRAVYF
jgi:hypothetical protein